MSHGRKQYLQIPLDAYRTKVRSIMKGCEICQFHSSQKLISYIVEQRIKNTQRKLKTEYLKEQTRADNSNKQTTLRLRIFVIVQIIPIKS